MIKKMIWVFGLLLFYLFPVFVCAAPCDPFTISCRHTSEALTRYPLSALSMAGVIHQSHLTWALIKAPDLHVYPVRVGHSIGLGGGKVMHITSQQVIVQQEKKSVTIRLQ